MKKGRKVIDPVYLPVDLHVLEWAAIFWLVCDRLGATGWVYGVGFTVLAFLLIVEFYDRFTRQLVTPKADPSLGDLFADLAKLSRDIARRGYAHGGIPGAPSAEKKAEPGP